MHAAQVLGEQIFAVEIVEIYSCGVVAIDRSRAQITAPESQPDVLSADMSLPFILRGKG